MNTLIHLVVGILSMRIYALYNRSRRILALLLITWAVVGAAGIVSTPHTSCLMSQRTT